MYFQVWPSAELPDCDTSQSMFVGAIDVSRNVTATIFSAKLSIILCFHCHVFNILDKLLNNLIAHTLTTQKCTKKKISRLERAINADIYSLTDR